MCYKLARFGNRFFEKRRGFKNKGEMKGGGITTRKKCLYNIINDPECHIILLF